MYRKCGNDEDCKGDAGIESSKVESIIFIIQDYLTMKVTYYLGAGASANSLPLVSDIPGRLRYFSNHIHHLFNSHYPTVVLKSLSKGEIKDITLRINDLASEVQQHFTIDTYAKKLSFHNDRFEYDYLLRLTSAYFIYEQLRKPRNIINEYLHNARQPGNYIDKILTGVDYRYDSFFAALLKRENDELLLPDYVNLVSWNYDFQLEQAYMNFNKHSMLDHAQQQLNVYPSPVNSNFDRSRSGIVKLNGTAAFRSLKSTSDTFGELFDFKDHELDPTSIEMLLNSIKLTGRSDYQSTMGFAWTQNNPEIKNARSYAKDIIRDTDIVVVIGYSFPYFNRNVDKEIFSEFGTKTSDHHPTIYIQTEEKSYKSIENRIKGVLPDQKVPFKIVPHLELDQFLIPNEMTIP